MRDGPGSAASVAVLVFAGGEGKRLGGRKPERMLGGRRLLDHALRFARSCGGGPLALGLRSAGQVEGADGVERVLDTAGIAGPLASLAAGFDWAQMRAAAFLLTLPCDAPFLPADLADRLQARIAGADAMAAVAMSAGRLHPSCALWRVEARFRLADYLASGRRSLTGFAEHVGAAVEDWGSPTRDPFFNINGSEDLAAAEERVRLSAT
jgi:molybdopterin-guanine dinucleotide biosynthesis protein A